MKKLTTKTLSFILTLSIGMGLSVPTFASENITREQPRNTIESTPFITETQKNRLNEWVDYNENTKQFFIKSNANKVISEKDYSLLENSISITNQNIAKADFSTNQIVVISPKNESPKISTRAFKEGVTKIEFHWWGATIYLSKSTINVIGGGVAIGGIWIPEPLVSKILSTLGVGIALCPGGIAFDYNYIAAGINVLIPGSQLIFSAVRNVRWQ